MRMAANLIVGAVTCATITSVSLGSLVIRESDDFVNSANGQYEADAIPQNASPSWTGVGSGQDYGVSGGELTLTTLHNNSRFFHLDPSFVRATGYTVEFRMRVDDIDDPRGPVLVRIADGTEQVELEWWDNSIIRWNSSSSVIPDPSVYRTYRIAYDPSADEGAGAYSAWIDNILVSDELTGNASTTNQLLFGDTSSSRYGGTTTWDYVRWDTTGAYAPIPEPASLALLGIGGALLLGRRRTA
ncbi:PEP-CTERM sorting domain-containing protein [Phycisphaerales bacterium AB-hyl4]|uniref:PEP-CTERM sorting domain-containing protein n=1 Tax=Natronomicrosphaera hydrolytica TaxID=3242702 RepID=A0ABV4UBC7_9BACT